MVTWIKKTAALVWRTLDAMADSTVTADPIFAHYNGRIASLEERICAPRITRRDRQCGVAG
jgi:hypothetical protein